MHTSLTATAELGAGKILLRSQLDGGDAGLAAELAEAAGAGRFAGQIGMRVD